VDGFEAAHYLVRARRILRLSQREMAALLGVGQSTWAGYESGARVVPHALLVAVLTKAGLRLAVVDEAGRQVAPFPTDAVRDNGGRRFPAHLEVQPPDRLPREAMMSPRYDRKPARAWYHLRGSWEAAGVVEEDGAWQRDHPTTQELEGRLRRRRQRRGPAGSD
jgi:transcriptional regulator with XRE-family HTH domain